MEFKSLNLQLSMDALFKTLAKDFGSKNCVWMSKTLINQLARISKDNWLAVDSLSQMDHYLFPLEDEKERLWFWEQGLKVKDVTTLQNPFANQTYTFYPIVHPDSPERLGLIAFENTRASLIEAKELFERSSRHIAFCLEHLEAKNMAYLDDLTSLFNQRYLPQVLAQEIDRCHRKNQKFSLLFLDVDYFKRVNDGHGHLTGSQLLVEVGKIIKTTIRSYDPLFRYGGDEFLALLVDTDRMTGEKVAERIRRAIESHEFVIDGKNISLTVSIGLSVFPDHAKSAQELIKLADQAMYYGKNKSRNIVYIAS